MDMRTSGKDYERYLDRAKNEYGVRLVRCRPHSVVRHAGAETLSVSYVLQDSDLPQEEDFDLVVLSTGFKVAEDVHELARRPGPRTERAPFRQNRKLQSRGHLQAGYLRLRSFRKPERHTGNHGSGQRRRLYGLGQSTGGHGPGRSGRPVASGAGRHRRRSPDRGLHLRLRLQYRRRDRCPDPRRGGPDLCRRWRFPRSWAMAAAGSPWNICNKS